MSKWLVFGGSEMTRLSPMRNRIDRLRYVRLCDESDLQASLDEACKVGRCVAGVVRIPTESDTAEDLEEFAKVCQAGIIERINTCMPTPKKET